MLLRILIACAGLMLSSCTAAEEMQVTVHKVTQSGVGEKLGTVTAVDTPNGVIMTPDLHGLSPGLHGFHIHENADCSPARKNGSMTAAAAAGGHLNPDDQGRHSGPYREGHLGDLPALYADSDGNVTHPVLAPKIEVSDLKGHALIVHEGGDNYTTQPKLGGGGSRVACAVVTG